jgi:hypothetical protein
VTRHRRLPALQEVRRQARCLERDGALQGAQVEPSPAPEHCHGGVRHLDSSTPSSAGQPAQWGRYSLTG